MFQFGVSAPGKIILFGEHAVVFGKTAIAASLDKCLRLAFAELPESEQVIKVSFPNVDLSMTLSLLEVKDMFSKFYRDYIDESHHHDLLYSEVQQFVNKISGDAMPQQKLSLEAFLYLLASISHTEKINLKPFHVHLRSQLPIGSGLGSSASFAVCFAACFLHWSRLQKGSYKTSLNEIELAKISRYAINCEKIMHGNPSGIDTTVCTYGSIIKFKKGEPINMITQIPNLIILIDTKVERSTKTQVQILADMKQRYPMIIDPILDSIEEISREVFRIIDSIQQKFNINEPSLLSEEYKQLMTFVDMNQALLSALQMSHSSLDKICTVARDHGLAAKLTGAGGGGHAYILLPPKFDIQTLTNISDKLTAYGFSIMSTSLGCSGVTIHED